LTSCSSVNLAFFMTPSQCPGAIFPRIKRSENRPAGQPRRSAASSSVISASLNTRERV
jgi:hypothetical protein